ncbi:MAG: KH domain-containing protein [Nanoarchaeota archaeon]|nr:KH domain-containing protein [Nanoarchaeota archaeon]MBU1703814.1 KH domain-containing protein [Nanoarchaeota archaeon]
MTEEFLYELKIPKERVAVLIGKSGETKTTLERETKTKIDVDSKEGDVTVSGTDALGLYTVREIIKAIGRGFNPEVAQLLLKPDYALELIDIVEFSGRSKDSLLRLKGRVIGREGKSRHLIEQMSEAYLCVYGKTIGIIGEPESALIAKQAIEMLLKGSNHSTVYKWLERKRRELKRDRIIGQQQSF